jgi:Protein of unknown function (DUF3046)
VQIAAIEEAGSVRLSEFWLAVSDEFGDAYGRILTHDLILGDIGSLTAEQAIKAGSNPRDIWLALCRAMDVPPARWHGAGQRDPKK